ncbi:MAG: hypothetical protein WDO19_15625 [Bacteroidota bacterium]
MPSFQKTDYQNSYKLYKDTCLNIQQLQQYTKLQKIDSGSTDLVSLITQLFNQLTAVFRQIGSWTSYMQLSDENYALKKYITALAKTKFSASYKGLKSLRQQWHNGFEENKKNIEEEPDKEYFNTEPWNLNFDYPPHWLLFGDDEPFDPKKDGPGYFLKFLQRIGDDLFQFYKSIITHAASDFEIQQNKKSSYPDTTLLRTLVSLLNIQQDQLNSITGKHLDFYYRDILKQKELPAFPDTAFVCATLLSTDAIYQMAAGTSFNAGPDELNNPILFHTVNNECLNPAAIVKASTLAAVESNLRAYQPWTNEIETTEVNPRPGPGKLLFLDQSENINKIQFREDGQIKSWKTFGGPLTQTGTIVNTGLAFASPMLYLPEGHREIVLGLRFAGLYDYEIFRDAELYLSTKTGWLLLSKDKQVTITYNTVTAPIFPLPLYTEATITIILESEEPSICAFSNNPDGYYCQWPLIKLQFGSTENPRNPPFIQSLSIDVHVTELKNFLLYNDNGALSTKTPYTPFGPVALHNSNFFIGSAEIFSKPLIELAIEIQWDNLPLNFRDYYQLYNDFFIPRLLIEKKTSKNVPGPSKPGTAPKPTGAWARISKFFASVFRKIAKAPLKAETAMTDIPGKGGRSTDLFMPVSDQPFRFDNSCFTTAFQWLQNGQWNPFAMKAPDQFPLLITTIPVQTCLPSHCIPIQTGAEKQKDEYLFRVTCDTCILTSSSYFSYAETARLSHVFKPDPGIQNSELLFTDSSSSGFMRMVLTGPGLGFGFTEYPKVVANIAMQNAVAIGKGIAKRCRPINLIPAANLPFVPMIKALTGQYKACQEHNLITQSGDYPLQCFLYSPFANYLVYDNEPGSTVKSNETLLTITGPDKDKHGIPLFPPGIPLYPVFNYNGALFLELSHLIPGNTLNLYFQLTRTTGNNNKEKNVFYYYLSPEGWKKLPVLDDGTNNFSCSGIIKLNIPGDITDSSPLMKGTNYRIAIAVDGNLPEFSETVYLSTNGFKVERSGTGFLKEHSAPCIKPGAITQPYPAIPQIATVIQPFHSFGGKAAEDYIAMNRRVSNRIKTKDRAVVTGDYNTLLQQQFDYVFYSKVIVLDQANSAVYLVKKVTSYDLPGSFLPFVTACQEEEVKEYLQIRVSPFACCRVCNFIPQYVRITVTVTIGRGYEEPAMRSLIDRTLKIYLSPWISSPQKQATIDKALYGPDVADCIYAIAGIESVTDITFSFRAPEATYLQPLEFFSVSPASPAHLFVSSPEHQIFFNKAA